MQSPFVDIFQNNLQSEFTNPSQSYVQLALANVFDLKLNTSIGRFSAVQKLKATRYILTDRNKLGN